MFGSVKKWIQDRKERSEIVAIVMLQSMPRLMNASSVESALSEVGISVTLREERTSYLRGIIDGFEITIASLPSAYPGLLNTQLPEERLTDACANHVAFTTIDTWTAPQGHDRKEARPIMAKIAAALTDEYVLAYYDWTSHRFCLPDENIVVLLAEGEIDQAIARIGDGVFIIGSDDEQFLAATAEAQRRWPEFVEAFSKGASEYPYTVKAVFTHGDFTEHLWIEVSQCDLTSVTGKIINKPYHLPRPRLGDVVTIPFESVSDWMIINTDGIVGGFVESLIQNR